MQKLGIIYGDAELVRQAYAAHEMVHSADLQACEAAQGLQTLQGHAMLIEYIQTPQVAALPHRMQHIYWDLQKPQPLICACQSDLTSSAAQGA